MLITKLISRPAFHNIARSPTISITPIFTRQIHATYPKMGVHNIRSQEEFKTTIASNKIVIIDAFATWCGPCKAIAPQIVKWSEDARFSDKIHFAKFDVDELPEVAQELNIRAMPTFTFFVDGEKADEFVGANPSALLKLLEKQVQA